MTHELDLIGFAEYVWVESFAFFIVLGFGFDLMGRFSLIDDPPFDLREWVWWILASTAISVGMAVYWLRMPPPPFQ